MVYTARTRYVMDYIFHFYSHHDVYTKDGLNEIFHVLEVATQMKREEECMVALLHEFLENQMPRVDLELLGVTNEEYEAILVLTRIERGDYFDYIKKIAKNPLATVVKIADLKHNMDLSRLSHYTSRDLERNEKYKQALIILEAAHERNIQRGINQKQEKS